MAFGAFSGSGDIPIVTFGDKFAHQSAGRRDTGSPEYSHILISLMHGGTTNGLSID